MALTLALTGGTGFVGGHAISEALRRGHAVRALARSHQPPRNGLEWIRGSLADEAALRTLATGADAVVHIAGVTNAADRRAFEQGNVLGTATLRRAIGALPLVHVSSLSAREPRLSTYGWSKLAGEQIARGTQGPVAIVRPPAVYGPGDREFLELMKTARTGFVPFPANSIAAMIYGPDLAEALVALAEDLAGPAHAAGQSFEIDDGAGGYSPAEVAAAVGSALGRTVRPFGVSPTLLHLAALGDTAFARLKGDLPRISRDRAGYMAHLDWSADSSPLRALGIWQPTTGLAKGMAATAIWYRAQGLLA
jgi:nucleoside-diphosphate-sugar epimerase